MNDFPEDDLEESRAALAPTLDATAAILPWVNKPKAARFDGKLNERWIAALAQLSSVWSERHREGLTPIRPAIFSLYGIALETHDGDCLQLAEALASTADRLDGEAPTSQLTAALSATLECLTDPAGLEQDAFAERARHFATRLENCAARSEPSERSAILDQLFLQEARELLDLLQEAIAALPPDAYGLATAAGTLAQQAETAELWGIMHQARQLAATIHQHAADLDAPPVQQRIEEQLAQLGTLINAVEP